MRTLTPIPQAADPRLPRHPGASRATAPAAAWQRALATLVLLALALALLVPELSVAQDAATGAPAGTAASLATENLAEPGSAPAGPADAAAAGAAPAQPAAATEAPSMNSATARMNC